MGDTGYGDGGWIGPSDPTDNYCYDNYGLRAEIQADTASYCNESAARAQAEMDEHRVSLFGGFARALFSLFHHDDDVVDAEME